MRRQASEVAPSWVPFEAVTAGVFRVSSKVGTSHHDDPPPDRIDDVNVFLAANRVRLADRQVDGTLVATVGADTTCRAAVAERSNRDENALHLLASGHNRESVERGQ